MIHAYCDAYCVARLGDGRSAGAARWAVFCCVLRVACIVLDDMLWMLHQLAEAAGAGADPRRGAKYVGL